MALFSKDSETVPVASARSARGNPARNAEKRTMTEKLVETAKATIDSAGREAERARLEIRYDSIWRVLMLLTMRERCKCSSEWSVDGMCVTTSTPTPRLKLRDKQEHGACIATPGLASHSPSEGA